MEYEIEDEALFDHDSTNPSLESDRQREKSLGGDLTHARNREGDQTGVNIPEEEAQLS